MRLTHMRLAPAIGALLLICPPAALAQGGPSVAFPQVTAAPVPLESASGRFSSLNPLDQHDCRDRQMTGRVISPRLILADHVSCGRPGHDKLFVNVELANPADAAQMVPGRRVTIRANFKVAEEDRDPVFVAEFVIAQNAQLVGADPPGPPQPFTSYMICQPPELDTLAAKLGKELCAQSSLVENLAAAGPALEAAARVPQKLAPEDAVPGDPDAISCRLDPGVSDRHLTAVACARNSYWAWYKAKWHDPWSSTPAPL